MAKSCHVQWRASGFGLQHALLLGRHPLGFYHHWRNVLYGTDRGWTISLGQLPFATSSSKIPKLYHRYECQNHVFMFIILIVLGWLTVAGWIGAFAVTSFGVSSLIQNLAAESQENYSPQRWQGTLIYWGLLLLCMGINTICSAALPYIEVLILVLHILGFAAILLTVAFLSPHVTADEVFATFLNEGGWSTQTLAFFVGISGNAAAFLGLSLSRQQPTKLTYGSGTDGAVHVRHCCQRGKSLRADKNHADVGRGLQCTYECRTCYGN